MAWFGVLPRRLGTALLLAASVALPVCSHHFFFYHLSSFFSPADSIGFSPHSYTGIKCTSCIGSFSCSRHLRTPNCAPLSEHGLEGGATEGTLLVSRYFCCVLFGFFLGLVQLPFVCGGDRPSVFVLQVFGPKLPCVAVEKTGDEFRRAWRFIAYAALTIVNEINIVSLSWRSSGIYLPTPRIKGCPHLAHFVFLKEGRRVL